MTPQGEKTRVLVFEDNDALRDLLYFMLNATQHFVCVNAYPDTRQLIQRVESNKPSLIVMDIELPGVNGIEATRQIKEQHPDIHILILTVFDDADKIFHSLCAGGSGYLLKDSQPEDIIQALLDVEKGGSPLSPSVARRVVHFFQNNAGINIQTYKLTPKEKEVLQHMVDGKSYKMMGDSLNVSLETIKTHVKNIYKKLHVNSSAEAVVKAIRGGIV
jgi:DNA-binding NarL/FixJ family response regulator